MPRVRRSNKVAATTGGGGPPSQPQPQQPPHRPRRATSAKPKKERPPPHAVPTKFAEALLGRHPQHHWCAVAGAPNAQAAPYCTRRPSGGG